jgi:hypothetical protein
MGSQLPIEVYNVLSLSAEHKCTACGTPEWSGTELLTLLLTRGSHNAIVHLFYAS